MAKTSEVSGYALTIVGGQPSRPRRSQGPAAVPDGIGTILHRAARDAGFKRRLLEDREGSLAECGVNLSGSERAALNAVSAASLLAMIAGISVQD